MTLEITEREREFLLELLKAEHSSLLDELHHTESYDYKQMLKEKDGFLKMLKDKVEALAANSVQV